VNQKQLIETLKTLHEELSQGEQIDPPTLDLLKTVTVDIQRLLERSGNVPANDTEPVVNGLQELLLRFEGKHPRLATLIEQVTDGLANLGI